MALEHVNFQYLNILIKNKFLDGLPEKIESTHMKCANCIESKMSNEPFENNRTRAVTEILFIRNLLIESFDVKFDIVWR